MNVAVKVLGAHVVVDADVAPLEQRPEAFDAVCVRHVPHVLPDAVVDLDVIIGPLQAVVGAEAIGDDRCASTHVLTDEALDRGALDVLNSLGTDFAMEGAEPDNRCLANGTTTRFEFLIAVLVAFFAADVRLVYLSLTAGAVATLGQPSFADALSEEPRGLLGDAKFAGHLGARDTLAGTGEHEDRQKPLDQREATFGQNRAGANTEMLAAILATVSHRLVIFTLGRADRAAVAAYWLIAPTLCLKELARRFFVRELLEELEGGKRFGLRLSHLSGSLWNPCNLTSHGTQGDFG